MIVGGTGSSCVAQERVTLYESNCASDVGMVDGDSELACQFRAQGQGNGIGELLDGEPIALEDTILDGSCGEAVRAWYSKVARARSSRLELLVWAQSSFFEFGVEPSTMSLKFARRWRKYKALLANSGRSVVNETPVMMARETFLERLYRFNQHLLLPRLAHLVADATTPAQRPGIRIVQQKLVPGFEGPIPTLATEVRLGLAHGRGIFAFEVVDTNVNMMRAMFKLSLHRFQFFGRSRGCS